MLEEKFQLDFLVIGAMKCGTTTFNELAGRHPDLFLLDEEARFWFSDSRYSDGSGLSWYRDWFREHGRQSECVVGESSGYYGWPTKYPEMPARMAKHFPNLKLVYLARDPLRRLISHYNWQLANGVALRAPVSAIRQHSYLVEMSLYHTQLGKYLEWFPREAVKVILFEDLVEAPNITVRDFWRWVGVDDRVKIQSEATHFNPTGGRMRDTRFLQFVRGLPGFESCASRVGPELRSLAKRALKTKRPLQYDWEAMRHTDAFRDIRSDAERFVAQWNLDPKLWPDTLCKR